MKKLQKNNTKDAFKQVRLDTLIGRIRDFGKGSDFIKVVNTVR